jgi:formylglycine-generating enzyme required for sulfatase activity/serine/threonine protein kinase
MADSAADAAFAREALQMGAVTAEQIEAARKLRNDKAQHGAQLSLGEALVQQGVITAALRQNIEKRLGPKVIGPYQLLSKLGEGAMGAVYRAKVVKTGIEVAVKILPKKFAEDQSYIARFLREAKAGLELEHAHVVRTVDFGDFEGVYFIALELVEGGDLSKKLKTLKLLPEPDALRIVHEVTLGLQHAHERGLVHRDIKPANIMFTKDGKAKLSDFGLVKYTDPEASHLTQTGMAVGTPHYIAPEQAKGEKDVDIRADIYSLGATLYHLVTGRPPYEGSSVGEVIMKHLTAQLTPPDEINPALSDGCVALIEKMMAKEREDRYATPAELAADLERVRRGEMPTTLIEVGRSSVAVSTQRLEKRAGVGQASSPVRPLPRAGEGREARERLRGEGARVAQPPAAPVSPSSYKRGPGGVATRGQAGTAGQAGSGTRRNLIIGGVAALVVLVPVLYLLVARAGKPAGGPGSSSAAKPDPLGKAAPKAASEEPYRAAMAEARRELDGEKTADGCFYELSAEKRAKAEAALLKALSAKPGDAAAKDLQSHLSLPKELALDLGDGVKMEFVLIPAGEFMMGDESIPDAKPVHKVRITKPFYLGKYEVTQAQYEKVTGSNPSKFKGPDLPVEQVSWEDAKSFCRLLNKLAPGATGAPARGPAGEAPAVPAKLQFGLPTEAEWEYACRAGTITAYYTGEGEAALKEAGWYTGNSAPKTHPVGQKKPNVWGLHDMHGNVWEWVEDIYGREYYTESPPADPPGPEVGGDHVMRGGAWTLVQRECRSAFRYHYYGGTKTHDYGFRVVVEPSFGTFSSGAGAQAVAANLKPETVAWPLHDGKGPVADYAKRVGLPATETLDLGDGVKMEFVLIPAGEFMMGDETIGDAKPEHKVRITKPFYLGKYEVTQAQYEKVGHSNPSKFKSPDLPVEQVSWDDAKSFCNLLTKLCGAGSVRLLSAGAGATGAPARGPAGETPAAPAKLLFRLPTEAEWEYACRAGTITAYYTGEGEGALKEAGWYKGNAGGKTHPVGQKKPNAWGLYDMHGNVWESVEDRYGDKYYAASPGIDPPGSATGNECVLRGGSWHNAPGDCRSAFRIRSFPGNRNNDLGFRGRLDF